MRLRTALILDDEEERRGEMREGLREHGVASDEAASVEEAIRRLVSKPYDLVVCDMILCDPPGAANPELRGYLAVCFALSRHGTGGVAPRTRSREERRAASARPGVVVQASSLRRWAHPGAVLTNWRVEEVADLVYDGAGIPPGRSADGGCPWDALCRVTSAPLDRRRDAVRDLIAVPVVGTLEPVLGPALEALEDAAEDGDGWERAVAGAWAAFFPGAHDAP